MSLFALKLMRALTLIMFIVGTGILFVADSKHPMIVGFVFMLFTYTFREVVVEIDRENRGPNDV